MTDKKTFITLIVLLSLSVCAAVIGTYWSFNRKSEDNVLIDDNPTKEFIYNNKAYFYYNNTLLATYDCPNCSKVVTSIDDTNYHTNYFHNRTYELPAVLNSNVALINENGSNYVFSIALGRTLNSFTYLKDYRVEHTEPILIANNGNYWGVLTITDDALLLSIEYQYDYIAIPAHLVDGKLSTLKLIAKSGDSWYILNNDGTSDYPAFNHEIIDFNDNYYVTYEYGLYHVYDYNNQEYLTNIMKYGIYAAGDYIFVLNSDNSLSVYYDCNANELERLSIPTYETIYFNETDAGLELYLDGNLYQTLELE